MWREWQYFRQWKARRAEFNELLWRVRVLELDRYREGEIYEKVRAWQMNGWLRIMDDEIGPLVATIRERTERGRGTVEQALDAFAGRKGARG